MALHQAAHRTFQLGARLRDILGRALTLCVSLTLFALMLVTFVDVVGRNAFNVPLPGGFEITELIMGVLMFTSLPLLTLSEGHVVVTLLDNVITGRTRTVQRLAINVISAVALAVLAWRLWDVAEKLARFNDVTMFLRVPLAPMAYFMSVATWTAFVLAVLVLLSAFKPDGGARAGSV